ncbi:MAG: 2-succinylbenzoate--CoA ligase [Microcoleaceae cyanobacterium]
MKSVSGEILKRLEKGSTESLIGCCLQKVICTFQQQTQIIQDFKVRDFEPKSRKFKDCTTIDDFQPKILLIATEPEQFLGCFLAAVVEQCPVFLCNPNWAELEWKQVFQQVQPDLILGDDSSSDSLQTSLQASTFSFIPHGSILIPTGGSSGKIQFVIHTWETLTASVIGFQQFFGRSQIHSFCTLPLYHVSGLMQFIRSWITNGKLAIFPFKAVERGQVPNVNFSDFFISLVPTQLQRLLTHAEQRQWLTQFHTVLLGGAPAWPELLSQARQQNIQLAPTYGMTETASQIVTLKPKDFLSGHLSVGQVLPHATVKIHQETGEECTIHQSGLITIQASSLMWGYYDQGNNHNSPLQTSPLQTFSTDDLGYFDLQGYLTIVGRNSQKIITGGENVFPAEIESVIRSTNLVKDVCVIGWPDADWGQVVTAVYVPINSTVSEEFLKDWLQNKLSKYKLPKYWICIDQLPRNPQGKINQLQVKEQIASQVLLISKTMNKA